MTDPNQKPQQPITSAGMGPQLSAEQSAADRARLLLRVALSGVQLPFEVFDAALTRATAVLARYQMLDAQARQELSADGPDGANQIAR